MTREREWNVAFTGTYKGREIVVRHAHFNLPEEVMNKLADEVVAFIYGGGKYAAKQLTTA